MVTRRVSEDFNGFLANASGYQNTQFQKLIRPGNGLGVMAKAVRAVASLMRFVFAIRLLDRQPNGSLKMKQVRRGGITWFEIVASWRETVLF